MNRDTMPRRCTVCDSPKAADIDRRFRQGAGLDDVRRWASEQGVELSRAALSRHRIHHVGMGRQEPGAPPLSGDFLTDLRDDGHEGLRSGRYSGSLALSLRAQELLDRRTEATDQKALIAKITQALTGQLPGLPDPDEIEGEYREAQREYARLLPGGDLSLDLSDDELRERDKRETLARVEARQQ